MVEDLNLKRILPEKGFWRRTVNSPEGGGAMERGIVIDVMWLFGW